MLYAAVFCAATLSALLLLYVAPARGVNLVKARLGALDALGPGPALPERTQQVLERRKAKARQLQTKQQLVRGSKLAVLVLVICGTLFGAARAWGIPATMVGAAFLVIGTWASRKAFRHWRGRRVAFQLPEAVRMLADSLHESNSLDQALEHVAKQAPRAAARELSRVRRALRQGHTEERAFGLLAARNPSPEVEMLVSCLAMPHERGRRLAESLRPLQTLLESRIQLAKARAKRMRLLSWGLFVPISAAMVYAGTAGSLPILAGWSCFAIGTLLIAWVSSVKGGLA